LQNKFDRNKLHIKSLNDRKHDLDVTAINDLETVEIQAGDNLSKVAADLLRAKNTDRATILFMGGHVIRAGVQRYLIDLIKRGYINCLAMNGACIIHDYEFALVGATTESVARYISEGQFGLWRETGKLNDIINSAFAEKSSIGLGAAVGRYISNNNLPHQEISLLAAAYKLGIPATVHVGIGYDIIHELPNFDGAATGALSYNDFLTLASIISNLEGGVVMNFGSAVMAPEVYLKALSMARNVAFQEKREIRHFTNLVCDLAPLPEDISVEPCKTDHSYYFRPLKTMLIRTVADGGKSYYVRGNHATTIPALWTHVNHQESSGACG
jgi:hypothetical protein